MDSFMHPYGKFLAHEQRSALPALALEERQPNGTANGEIETESPPAAAGQAAPAFPAADEVQEPDADDVEDLPEGTMWPDGFYRFCNEYKGVEEDKVLGSLCCCKVGRQPEHTKSQPQHLSVEQGRW